MSEPIQGDMVSKGLHRMISTLDDDLRTSLKEHEKNPTQYHRRVLIRALFAKVEAVTYALKQECLHLSQQKDVLYSFEEIALLKEETYALDNRGEPSSQAKFLPTEANFRFAVNMYARETQPGYSLDVADNGWNHFKQALQVRHRITHPKSFELLEITDEEMKNVSGAITWVSRTIMEAIVTALAITRRQNVEMQVRAELLIRLIPVAAKRGFALGEIVESSFSGFITGGKSSIGKRFEVTFRLKDFGQAENLVRHDATVKVNGSCLYNTDSAALEEFRIDSEKFVWRKPDGESVTSDYVPESE